ncbi:MAG: hypothetical protein GY854_22110 [Deltaproteobacteria bacterium]|nr:hypothetical protein [Deltaproteobacteria bacterium]
MNKTICRFKKILGMTILSLGVSLLFGSPAEAYSFPILRGYRTTNFGLYGRELNGTDFNGKILDGRYITKVSLKDVKKDGDDLFSVRLKGTRFKGVHWHGKKVKNKHFTNTRFLATLDDGSTLELWIDAVESRKEREDKDIVRYSVSYETIELGRTPMCGVDEYGYPIQAIPLEGRWDYSEGTETGGMKIDDADAFTFACEGYVLAKCVHVGYKPWKTAKVCEGKKKGKKSCRTVDLAEYHQACTRMLRADYCGDGTPHTEDGIYVNVYDALGIRIDGDEWFMEAEWDVDGAICMSRERIDQMAPECAPYLQDDTCGDISHFEDGALIITEIED